MKNCKMATNSDDSQAGCEGSGHSCAVALLRCGFRSVRTASGRGHMAAGQQHSVYLSKRTNLSYTAEQDDSGGRFNVHYELHAEGSLLGTYELTITYTEGTK